MRSLTWVAGTFAKPSRSSSELGVLPNLNPIVSLVLSSPWELVRNFAPAVVYVPFEPLAQISGTEPPAAP
jgi:hypothetical protein